MKTFYVTSDPTISKGQIIRIERLVSGKVDVLNKNKMTFSETIRLLGNAEILLGGSSGFGYLDKSILEKLHKLKMISILGVGTDWIDLKAASELGIIVCNAKGANAESVAEHVWGMILSLSKRITEADRNVKEKGEYKFINYLGKEVYKKTLGVVGLGEIGKRVTRIAHAFDMQVLGVNKSKKRVSGVKLVDIDELCKNSDIIAVCVAFTDETENMFSRNRVGVMKPGVILVSSSRESIIDQSAIVEGLITGKIGGYGYDADIMKGVSKNNKLLKFPNVIITPHNAFFTKEADVKTDDVCIDNVEFFLKGKPINVVN